MGLRALEDAENGISHVQGKHLALSLHPLNAYFWGEEETLAVLRGHSWEGLGDHMALGIKIWTSH